ncbi:MAG: ion channel, partial [Acidobacteriota bacterium]|nr:ion channel [Acidobacteriota bacterium]
FDPGLTNQYGGELRRAIEKDGSFNVRRRGGVNANFYLFLIDTTWPKFVAVVAGAYLMVNLLFAALFVAVGTQHLAGVNTNTGVGPFESAFFFSVQTLTTVGYGSVYPVGMAANSIAAIEAMTGLMGFALATGLLYGRFSRPSAKIAFSDVMIVAPYQDGTSLQFRIANQRDNVLLELEANVLMMYVDKTEGEARRKFAGLNLERSSVYFFPLTWTVVHPITADSPIYGKSAADLAEMQAEFLILIKAFDDTFSQTVHARYSYRHGEVEWGARFQPAFFVDGTGDMVLELNRLHDRKLVEPSS